MDKTLEQIRSYAEQGRYKRRAVCRCIYADQCDADSAGGKQTLLSVGKCGGQTAVGKIFLPWICTNDGDHLYRWACDHQRRA